MPSAPQPTRLLEAQADEAPAVEEMARRIWPDAYREIISEAQIRYMLDRMYSPSVIAREIEAESIRYFWIVGGDEKLGFLAAGPFEAERRSFLHKCYVLPAFVNRGHGSRGLSLLIAKLREASATGIELRVNRGNARAIAFYRRNGFAIVAEDCLDIGAGFAMDDFVMRLEW
ncbi:MAG: GNAT family N-acetyltransferase [Verrucomicrobiales bacterium]